MSPDDVWAIMRPEVHYRLREVAAVAGISYGEAVDALTVLHDQGRIVRRFTGPPVNQVFVRLAPTEEPHP